MVLKRIKILEEFCERFWDFEIVFFFWEGGILGLCFEEGFCYIIVLGMIGVLDRLFRRVGMLE